VRLKALTLLLVLSTIAALLADTGWGP